ncbi:Dolichyl-phosphate-mannose-protein mannosyltransferase [Lysobacter spongiicola DSM 21749]|uniref:Dolichyl-phosphate-mannose-protein mannosyltransferase n=1 Tax=Lysobacter spongiicola DSM 21749 TaxID=1122188 RepID=A0A1T4NWJ3_9GAMM|nr:Dolichyl-phosphate-mannose-protein mannosyltransferase [Lysobacter spongiicola DSM 21749]
MREHPGMPAHPSPIDPGVEPFGMDPGAEVARRIFLALFVLVFAVKLLVAARLPLFVDEAFYWLEGQHLAPAYSDLPGLTAWMARLGVTLGGDTALGLRLPFLLMAALVPWLVVKIARRTHGDRFGWQAGSLALLLPLAGTLGLMALPDAAMALATLLCIDAGARLLRRVDALAALELATGLVIGALSHYRFIAVIGVGFVALLLLPEGRRALRDARVWTAVAIGAAAWTPLVAWNFDNADAGLRFQLVDRHPWSFHWEGLYFIAIQALMVTRSCSWRWRWRRGGAGAAQCLQRATSPCWAGWSCSASSPWGSSPIPSGSVSIGHCRATSRCCRWFPRCWLPGPAGCGCLHGWAPQPDW